RLRRADTVPQIALSGRTTAHSRAGTAEQSDITLTEVCGVHRDRALAEHTTVVQHLGRRPAVHAPALLVLVTLLGQVHVQRARSRPRANHGRRLGRYGTDRVGRHARTNQFAVRAERRSTTRPPVHVGIRESRLLLTDRRTEPGAQVTGVEQAQPDTGL